MRLLRGATAALRLGAVLLTLSLARPAPAADLRLPLLVPVTGFLALEGASQRNGALLAFDEAEREGLRGVVLDPIDTQAAPETAVTAFERALRAPENVPLVFGPMLGTQMLALSPLAKARGIPMTTVAGTAGLTGPDNRTVFRFFPSDSRLKQVHAAYATGTMALRRPALITQTTAYGQSGRRHLGAALPALGATLVADETIAPTLRDFTGLVERLKGTQPDGYVLHLHAQSSALLIRALRGAGITAPIIAGSALHQPATAALLDPGELAGVCAESGSAPAATGNSRPALAAFAAAYRARFQVEPDAFAAAQYDATRIVLALIGAGQRSPAALTAALRDTGFNGAAMAYRDDGTGDLAHDAVILCYDGHSRVPEIVESHRGK